MKFTVIIVLLMNFGLFCLGGLGILENRPHTFDFYIANFVCLLGFLNMILISKKQIPNKQKEDSFFTLWMKVKKKKLKDELNSTK